MLTSWFVGAAAEAVGSALDAAAVDGVVAVLGNPRLARALADQGRVVVAVGADAHSLRRAKVHAVCSADEALPFGNESLGAVVAAGPLAGIDEWSRAVVEGGPVVLVDKAAATEMSRRALCGGLLEIEQRDAGRTVVTSGKVVKL